VHATRDAISRALAFEWSGTFLESGIARPGAVDTGWLNRALVALASDGQVDLRGSRALGVGSVTPLVVRGKAPVMSWVPQQCSPPATTRRPACWTCISTPNPRLAVAAEARIRLAALGPARAPTIQCPTELRCHRLAFARVRAYFADALAQRRAFSPRRTAACRGVGLSDGIRHNEGAAPVSSPSARSSRRRVGSHRDQHGRSLARDGGRHHHGVRTHRAHQRHDEQDHGTGTVAFLAAGALRADAWSPTGRD